MQAVVGSDGLVGHRAGVNVDADLTGGKPKCLGPDLEHGAGSRGAVGRNTGSLNQPIIALIGNGVVLAVAAIAVWSIWPISKLGAGLLMPVIAWVSLASVALVALITGQPF